MQSLDNDEEVHGDRCKLALPLQEDEGGWYT